MREVIVSYCQERIKSRSKYGDNDNVDAKPQRRHLPVRIQQCQNFKTADTRYIAPMNFRRGKEDERAKRYS